MKPNRTTRTTHQSQFNIGIDQLMDKINTKKKRTVTNKFKHKEQKQAMDR